MRVHIRGKRALALAALSCVLAGTGAVRAAVVNVTQNFDTPGQLANFNTFIATAGTSTGGITESTTGGVSNSGSLAGPQATTTDTTLTYAPQAFDFSQVGETITESIIFKTNASFSNVPAGGVKPVQLGFLTLPAAGYNANANQVGTAFPAFTSLRLNIATAASAAAQLQLQDKTAAGATATVSGSTVTLTGNEYYQVSLVATQNGGGSYTLSGALQDLGTDGATITGAAVPFASTVRTGFADLATTVYAGFRDQSISGAANYDNFTVSGTAAVPEPASLGLIAAGVGMVIRRRRRA